MKKFIEVALVLSILLLTSISSAQAQTAYTSDTNIAHFTAGITSYATLSNFNNIDGCVGGLSFTPTSLELATTGCRVYNGTLTVNDSHGWILATFTSPVSRIVVFPNIDHYGSSYDGYQYQIYGSNDYGSSDSPNWTPLFNAVTVTRTGEPFTLVTSSGTPPSTVNNVLTPQSVGLPAGCSSPNPPPCSVGYIATFNFSTAYKYYAFGTSAVATTNTEQELSAVGASSQTKNLQFTPTMTTQVATIGDPGDQAAQSLALTLASVMPNKIINVSVEFFYEPTEFSTGLPGVGVADGECEPLATDITDFDCRLLPFTYPANLTPPLTLPDGGQLVPHIIPSHNNLGVWVRVIATLPDGSPAVAGRDYANSVDWYYAINTNPSLVPGGMNQETTGLVNPEYLPGWNNMNLQMYDRPGTIINSSGQVVTNPNIDFVKNITTYFKTCDPNCVGNADPGVGGHTITLNDIVIAAPPNPPAGTAANTVEPLVPVPGISPFPYFKSLPMLVSFELEKPGTETSITNALTSPNSVSVATFQTTSAGGIGNNIPVQIPRGFPSTFTYNAFLKTYYIFLSPAPYTPGTKYILQINSALFPAPVNATFVVK